jgi:hypothetical protein
LECGITVYPARSGGGRWRAVWHEDGQRQQCEAATEDKLTAKRMISALVTARIDAGYLVNFRLAKVHWQAGDRLLPAPAVSVAGESAQWVDPAEIPSDGDVARLGQALADGVHGDRDELMANTAAYGDLRWGELIAHACAASRRTSPPDLLAGRLGRSTGKGTAFGTGTPS